MISSASSTASRIAATTAIPSAIRPRRDPDLDRLEAGRDQVTGILPALLR